MRPPNRRVGRQKLPAEIAEAEGALAQSEPAGEEVAAAPPPAPQSRLASAARATLGVALVLGVSVVAALGARRYVTTTPRFAVKDIVVTGNARRSVDDVAAEAGIAKGANVFSLDLERSRAKLLSDPWMREVTLSRRLPGTVFIQVTERDAAAIVALGDSYLASRDGDIFKRLEPGDPTDLPVVTGLTPDAVADDREGAVRSVKRALDLAADYERTSLAQRAPLEEVHLAEGGGLTLFVGKSAVALELGSAPFHRKIEEAARVMAELDRRGAKADAVLLDNEARPERVVVRVR
jgi:cell division protein FtsQ